MSRRLIATVTSAALMLVTTAGVAHAVDDDPAAWGAKSDNNCSVASGFINYVRVPIPNTCRRNITIERDGDLRDSLSTYTDNYRIGNLYGGSPNTDRVWNMTSITMTAWTGTCYSGTPYGIFSGSSWSPGVYSNLRSLANYSISACGQP